MFDKMVDSRCNYACDGNSSQKCGGEWPLKSVYETGIERKFFLAFIVTYLRFNSLFRAEYAFDNTGKEFQLELPQASQNIYFDVDIRCDYCYDDDDV